MFRTSFTEAGTLGVCATPSSSVGLCVFLKCKTPCCSEFLCTEMSCVHRFRQSGRICLPSSVPYSHRVVCGRTDFHLSVRGADREHHGRPGIVTVHVWVPGQLRLTHMEVNLNRGCFCRMYFPEKLCKVFPSDLCVRSEKHAYGSL